MTDQERIREARNRWPDDERIIESGSAEDTATSLERIDELEGVTDHAPALEFVAEPIKSRILEDAKEMGRVVEITLAADCIMVGWEGGSLEVYK